MPMSDRHAATVTYLNQEAKHKQLLLVFTALVIFVVFAARAHGQTFSVVYNFGSQVNDPIQPYADGIIAQGRDGNLYSGALGGANGSAGAAYKVTPAGALTTLYSFATIVGDGYYPYGGLTLGTDGNFYGTTYGGGFASYGTVFKMTSNGGLTTLYTFTNGTDGSLPIAPPFRVRMETFTAPLVPAATMLVAMERFTKSLRRARSQFCMVSTLPTEWIRRVLWSRAPTGISTVQLRMVARLASAWSTGSHRPAN